MTPATVKDFYETIIDDEPDEDETYGLMDTAYTEVNEERAWAMLLKLDTSITHSPGDTWLTTKTLPSDFGRPYKLFGGNANNEYDPVLFENILHSINGSRKYALDLVNMQMRLIGSPASALTMYMWYLYVPTSLFDLTDLQKTATDTIKWPARFHRILAYKMAELRFGGIDADETSRKMSQPQLAEFVRLKKAMISWDNATRLRMMGTSSSSQSRGDASSQSDVVSW
jgi:hypothetical protein